MSTVTLSHPHCAITSAENPEGIASHPLTAALPAFHRSFTLLSATLCPFGCRAISPRHREGTLAKRWQARQMRATPATNEGASAPAPPLLERPGGNGRGPRPGE